MEEQLPQRGQGTGEKPVGQAPELMERGRIRTCGEVGGRIGIRTAQVWFICHALRGGPLGTAVPARRLVDGVMRGGGLNGPGQDGGWC